MDEPEFSHTQLSNINSGSAPADENRDIDNSRGDRSPYTVTHIGNPEKLYMWRRMVVDACEAFEPENVPVLDANSDDNIQPVSMPGGRPATKRPLPNELLLLIFKYAWYCTGNRWRLFRNVCQTCRQLRFALLSVCLRNVIVQDQRDLRVYERLFVARAIYVNLEHDTWYPDAEFSALYLSLHSLTLEDAVDLFQLIPHLGFLAVRDFPPFRRCPGLFEPVITGDLPDHNLQRIEVLTALFPSIRHLQLQTTYELVFRLGQHTPILTNMTHLHIAAPLISGRQDILGYFPSVKYLRLTQPFHLKNFFAFPPALEELILDVYYIRSGEKKMACILHWNIEALVKSGILDRTKCSKIIFDVEPNAEGPRRWPQLVEVCRTYGISLERRFYHGIWS